MPGRALLTLLTALAVTAAATASSAARSHAPRPPAPPHATATLPRVVLDDGRIRELALSRDAQRRLPRAGSSPRRPAPAVAPLAPAATHAPRAAGVAPMTLTTPASPVSAACTLYASPAGSDANPATRARPVRTAQKLADLLGPGRVGCLDGGTYTTPILALRHGGTSTARATLRSTPGQRALLIGQIWVAQGANFVTVAYVDHQVTYVAGGKATPSPVVNGNDALFFGMDVSAPHADTVCFFLGDLDWGVPQRTVIEGNRIHNCGKVGQNHRHGIYVAYANATQIRNNAIYDNPDRGIQLYPRSTNAVISANVIDGNGEGIIFSGDYGYASTGNVVEGNVITNSRLRNDVESWYPDANPIGKGNIVRHNCVFGGAFGPIQQPQIGFAAGDDLLADPGYVARGGDFSLRGDGACARFLAGG